MPIILGEYDEITAAPDCNVEIKPQPPQQPNPDCMPDQNPDCMPQQRMALAMAYVPWQKWQQPYDFEKGLMVGTIFPDLDLPFLGYQGGMKR